MQSIKQKKTKNNTLQKATLRAIKSWRKYGLIGEDEYQFYKKVWA